MGRERGRGWIRRGAGSIEPGVSPSPERKARESSPPPAPGAVSGASLRARLDVWEVETLGGQVRRHQHILLAGLEGVDGLVALLLGLAAVDGHGLHALEQQELRRRGEEASGRKGREGERSQAGMSTPSAAWAGQGPRASWMLSTSILFSAKMSTGGGVFSRQVSR